MAQIKIEQINALTSILENKADKERANELINELFDYSHYLANHIDILYSFLEDILGEESFNLKLEKKKSELSQSKYIFERYFDSNPNLVYNWDKDLPKK